MNALLASLEIELNTDDELVRDRNLQRLIKLVDSYNLSGFRGMLLTMAGNTVMNKADGVTEIHLGFRDAPAAKRNHHAYRGGLTVHLVEMWNLHLELRGNWNPDEIQDYRVLAGILLHDLHKAYHMFRWDEKEGKLSYTDHPIHKLLPKDMVTVQLLMNFGIPLDALQFNALLWSEGGWADCKPETSTALSKYLYALDELSGNVKGRTHPVMLDGQVGMEIQDFPEYGRFKPASPVSLS